MTRRTSILCGALAAIGMLTASVAHAEGIMPTSGYLLPQLSVFDADNDFGVAGKGPGLGLRYGMPLSDDIDLQLGISHARRSANGNKIEQTLFSADALYLFSRSDIRPFVSLGLEAVLVHTPVPQPETDTKIEIEGIEVHRLPPADAPLHAPRSVLLVRAIPSVLRHELWNDLLEALG